MSSTDFEDRLQRVVRIAEVIDKFDTPELKLKAFDFLLSDDDVSVNLVDESELEAGASADPPAAAQVTVAVKKSSSSKSVKKQSFDFDKSIDFYHAAGPAGLPLKEFVAAHLPKTVVSKAVVAVYWLKNELGLEEVTIDHVYSAFKTMEWIVPNDLANTLQQAGTKNFLDSKKRTDIKVTTHGENHVEHVLVPVVTP